MIGTNWEALFAPHILHRGRTYYEEGAVDAIRREGDTIYAVVQGSERYRVEISLEGGRIMGWACDCPYGEDGTPCKHLAAVFYTLDNDGMEEEPASQAGQTSVRKLIEGLTLEQARALLLRLAEQDDAVADQIRLAVEPPSQQLLQRWERKIDHLLAQAAGRHRYIEYDRAWDTMCKLDGIISDVAERFLDCGQVWEAFALTAYGFQVAAECDMDDSDGGLIMLSETCQKLWSAQIEAAAPELRRRMHRWFREACRNGGGLCRDILPSIQLELSWDPDLLWDDVNELEQMIRAEREKSKSEGWTLSRLVEQKLNLMEKLGVPKAVLWQAEAEYRDLPDVRKRIIARLLEETRYDEAEAVLRESKELDQKWPGLVSQYSEKLIAMYEKTGQAEKLQEELQFQVFHCNQRDLTYVKQLRDHVLPDRWPELRERLLASRTLYGELAEELLALDGLYGRLMERVTALGSLSALDRWEKTLRARFPERLQAAYVRCIEAQMAMASSRKQYAAVIAYLQKLRGPSERADRALAARWRVAYPRRRSMLDELTKAGY